MNGFLLIDKESGINSFKLVLALRRIANQKRVGFAGTLDPLASGLMILALGEYTKLLPYLEAKDKVYEVKIWLGRKSDSYDIDGQVEEVPVTNVPTRPVVEKLLQEKFTGKLEQRPPRFSAIQIGGRRAYSMAREGQEFELKRRPVEIFSVEILTYEFPFLRLRVHCSSGTYIRSLAHDLGEELGVGGVVRELRRTKVGEVEVTGAVKLDQLQRENLAQYIIDPREIFRFVEFLELDETQYDILARGNFIDNNLSKKSEQVFALYRGELAGVIETTLGGRKLKFRKKLNIF
jgi:tRNA pseudouridine55 synthase